MNTVSAETLSPITLNQIPVITTDLLAQLYGTKSKNISDNYLNNADRFMVGKHFFKIEKEELRGFKNRPEYIGLVGKNARSLILWTERGAARHAKMLETVQAWEVFEKLEDSYFCKKLEITYAPQARDIIEGDGHSLLIHFDDHNQISFTEKVPADAVVATMEKVHWWAAKNGYMMISRDEIKDMTLAQLLALK